MKRIDERLARLEEIAARMRGDIDVEESLKLFEEGIRLSKGLEKDIEKIEKRVEVLLNEPVKEEEKPELGLFDSIG
jgi:exodeoxyribonuclease VII small subunit